MKNVLYIEDNPHDVQIVRAAFDECGITANVFAVANAFLAYRYLSKQSEYAGVPTPDLIILDLNLPVVNGREVLKQLKADPKWSQIPVVVYSSTQRAEEKQACEKLGARFRTKPQTFAEIKKLVRDFEAVASGRHHTG
ncbi:MAG: response regulator [Planctomycetes bacterium]|nr:response regulator [Planctomycetota bacterium]